MSEESMPKCLRPFRPNSRDRAGRRDAKFALMIVALLAAAGCRQLGPGTITDARFDYANAIGRSAAESTLANLVRLRYAEMPIFLEVNQIVAGYSQEHLASSGLSLLTPFNAGKNAAQLGYDVKITERPTITYSLMSGEQFVKGYMSSMKADVIFTLADSGWPIDRLLRISAHSINGARNFRASAGERSSADPEFVEFVNTLRQLQKVDAMNVRMVMHDQTPQIEISFDVADMSSELRAEYDSAMTAVGLDPRVGKYSIIRGLDAEKPNSIAVHTRSVLQIMTILATAVEAPASHIEQGVAPVIRDVDSTPDEESRGQASLRFRVHSGLIAPPDAFVSVRHQGHAFWIANDDIATKTSFAFLSMLQSLTLTSEGAIPQLTISTN